MTILVAHAFNLTSNVNLYRSNIIHRTHAYAYCVIPDALADTCRLDAAAPRRLEVSEPGPVYH